MTGSCRRPGCANVAAVTIHYDPVSCQLWLDPIVVADRSAQALCVEHAERLSPPRGWVVVDRRGAQTTILSEAPAAVSAERASRTPRTPRRRWGSFEEPMLDFSVAERDSETDEAGSDEPENAAARAPNAEPEQSVEPEEPFEPEPQVEPVDDLADLLKPRGGLLSRAFAATGDQHSALTLPNEAAE